MVKKANASASNTGTDKDAPKAPTTGGWGSKTKPKAEPKKMSAPAKAMKEAAAASDAALEEAKSNTGGKSVLDSIKAAQEQGNYPDDQAISDAENEGMPARAPESPADASQPDQAATTQGESEQGNAGAPQEGVSGNSTPQPSGFPASAIEQAPNPMEDAKKAEAEKAAQAAADKATEEARRPPPKPNAADQQLISYCERIERLEEEKQAVADDIKEVYAELKAAGFDSSVFRVALRRRKMDPQAREEQDSILELYEGVLAKAARK